MFKLGKGEISSAYVLKCRCQARRNDIENQIFESQERQIWKGKEQISLGIISLKPGFRKEGNISDVTKSETVPGTIKVRKTMSLGENWNDSSEDAKIQDMMEKTVRGRNTDSNIREMCNHPCTLG